MGCQSQSATAHCRFYGRDEPSPFKERRLKDTRCTLPTTSVCLLPSFSFFLECTTAEIKCPDFSHFQRVSTYTDDNSVECTIVQWSDPDCDYTFEDAGLWRDEVHQNLTPHRIYQRLQGQCETGL